MGLWTLFSSHMDTFISEYSKTALIIVDPESSNILAAAGPRKEWSWEAVRPWGVKSKAAEVARLRQYLDLERVETKPRGKEAPMGLGK